MGGLIGDVSIGKAGLQPKSLVTKCVYYGSEDVYLRIAKLNNTIYSMGSLITCYLCWNTPIIYGGISFIGYNKEISYVNVSNILKNRFFFFDKKTGILYAKMPPYAVLIVSVDFYNGKDDIYLDKIISLDTSDMVQIII